jgi:triacylglycerol lipase
LRHRSLTLGLLVAGCLSLVAAVPRVEVASPARLDVPIVLVPGWLDTARDLAALRIRLLGAGASHVETITFAEPTGSNRDHAAEIDSVVTDVLAETGAERVDIVAHSMGGLATRWYLKTHVNAPVRRAVFIASPHRGTLTAHLAWGEGRDEMMPDSEFLESLNAGAAVPEDVEAMTIRTPIDTHVLPGESATLPGVEDHTVCCPTHQGLVRSDEVFGLVMDFLERTVTSAERR